MTAPATLRCLGLALLIVAAACDPSSTSPTDTPATAAPTPLTLRDTSVEPLAAVDYDAVHGPGDREPVFGALPIEPAGPDVPPATAAFLGRWEGYGLQPPIRRDWKLVLAVTSITAVDGTAHVWAATNLQYPKLVKRVHFRVRGTGTETTIEWEQDIDHDYLVMAARHATGTDALEAEAVAGSVGGSLRSVLLRRDSAEMMVDRDHAARLAGLGITWQPHEDAALLESGAGSLVHLPAGYDADPERRWPLVVFLHGSGDRGDNGLLLALNSPFRFVTAGNELPAIVVAPLLEAGQAAFPEAYLDGVLDDALARYRVDPERVAVTGLSMGGEAAYRLARHRSDDVGTLAVLCGFETGTFPASASWGYAPIREPWSSLAGTRVLVIHGDQDVNIPSAAGEAAVAAMREAGVDARLEILAHHDHDVWTDTYEDPAFFDWLLAGDGRP